MNKLKKRKGKVIFINGKDEVRLESAAYLKDEHIKRMSDAYWNYKNEDGFTAVVKASDILKVNNGNLSIQLYVKTEIADSDHSLEDLFATINENKNSIDTGYNQLNSKLKELGIEMS